MFKTLLYMMASVGTGVHNRMQLLLLEDHSASHPIDQYTEGVINLPIIRTEIKSLCQKSQIKGNGTAAQSKGKAARWH